MGDVTRIGVVFGCFIPLHRGHMDMIARAKAENDRVIIGVTGHDMDRGRDFVPFLRRVRLMERLYAIPTSVTVAEVDDRAIGLTGTFTEDAWRTWCAELFYRSGFNPDDRKCRYTWYTGEPDYVEKIRAVFPHHKFVLLDRTETGLSGTDIRKDFEASAKDVHPAFLEYVRVHSAGPNREKRGENMEHLLKNPDAKYYLDRGQKCYVAVDNAHGGATVACEITGRTTVDGKDGYAVDYMVPDRPPRRDRMGVAAENVFLSLEDVMEARKGDRSVQIRNVTDACSTVPGLVGFLLARAELAHDEQAVVLEAIRTLGLLGKDGEDG